MNSFNHYSLGSIGEWLYGYLGGIRPDIDYPGFKHFVIAPQIEGEFVSCDTSYQPRYGRIRVVWKQDDGALVLAVTIPPNSSATVNLPLAPGALITESGNPLTDLAGVLGTRRSSDQIHIELGSGDYFLRIDNTKLGKTKR